MKTRLGRGILAATVGLALSISWAAVAVADPEGATAAVRSALDEAVRGYLDAKGALDASKAHEAGLVARVTAAEVTVAAGQDRLGGISANLYHVSGLADVASVVTTGTPSSFLERVTLLNGLSAHEHAVLAGLVQARSELDSARAELETELAAQAEQLAAMDVHKREAEAALWANGGGQVTGGFNENSEVVAEAVARNPDGGLPGERCSVLEPTTGGCITPRTAHARDQAIAAGFDRYVACYRSLEDGGEHPRGRACDFAVSPGGFGGDAYDADRTYGNSLAAFFIYNADRLGVLYVIWYRQIWLPGTGWLSYFGCCDPSSKHTNHVHLSMY